MYVYDQARILTKGIRESMEYRTLMDAKKKVDGDPAAKKMISDYRTQQIELQKLQLLNQKVPDDKMRAFRQLHDIAGANLNVRNYLEAEQKFAVMMADVQKILAEGLNLSS